VLAADGIGYNDLADLISRTVCKLSAPKEETVMAKGSSAVYRVTDVIGTSPNSWEDAARNAVKTASKSLRDLRIAEVTKLDVKVEDGKVTQFRTRLSLSFKYDA
jgi:dodecin